VRSLRQQLSLSAFNGCFGSQFRVLDGPAGPVELDLAEATGLPPKQGGVIEPFSLMFHGPRDTLLMQKMYQVDHENLGAFHLFLVPLGPDEKGHRYEAIFN
jgi:hypothetical protein